MKKKIIMTLAALLFIPAIYAMEDDGGEDKQPKANLKRPLEVKEKTSYEEDCQEKDRKKICLRNNYPKINVTNVLQFPNELLLYIISFLSPEALVSFSSVNQHCSQLSEELARGGLKEENLFFPHFKLPNLTAYSFRNNLAEFFKCYFMLSQDYPDFMQRKANNLFNQYRRLFSFCQQNKLKTHFALFTTLQLKWDMFHSAFYDSTKLNTFLEKFYQACQNNDPLVLELGLILCSVPATMKESFLWNAAAENLNRREALEKFDNLINYFNEATLPYYAKKLINMDRLYVWRTYCPAIIRLQALKAIVKERDMAEPEQREKYYAEAFFQASDNLNDEGEIACSLLADCYFYGLGVEKDFSKVYGLLEGLDYGYDPDYIQGLIYQYGLGRDVGLKEARAHYKASIHEHSNVEANYQLIIMDAQRNSGQITRKTKERLKHAADNGHCQAAYLMGEIYRKRQNLDASKAYYAIAARGNHPQAMRKLGVIYKSTGNYDWALELFQRAAELGDKKSIHKVFDIMRQCFLKRKSTPEFIQCWTNKAADQNHAPALYDIGLAYLSGDFGLPIDHEKAKEYIERSIAAGKAQFLINNFVRQILEFWGDHEVFFKDFRMAAYNKAAKILGLPLLEPGAEINSDGYRELSKACVTYKERCRAEKRGAPLKFLDKNFDLMSQRSNS